jgi:phosphoribosylaminoimidazolecarboxamide formyltransferase/IMP cyclohydrolase
MANPQLANLNRNSLDTAPRFRYVRGGFLLQPNYTFILDLTNPDLVKIGQPTIEQEDDMLLAKAICDTSNSNTITVVLEGMLAGNGVGQQARVYGAQLALTRAQASEHYVLGASAASDSFFPFTDGVEVLAKAGIKAIISSSGSVKDKDVIKFCEEKGIMLYLIPDSKGRGFFGH